MSVAFDWQKSPAPWFGGKTDAAPLVWEALGDVPHYVEPFAGMLAVLLRRPHESNRTYYSETVNDLDGLLVNLWRSIQFSPQETAEAASWPVSEFDKHARNCAVLKWRASEAAARLAGNPTWHDPQMGGWWVWCLCVTIGGWGLGGPWWPDAEGKLRKRPRGKRQADGEEPGVRGNRPQLGDGQGVNNPQLREPGITANLPQLTDNGRGVNKPQLREPGIWADLPHLADNGRGVNHAGLREPGLTCDQRIAADYEATGGYHPLTMPKLRRWFDFLSARLRHVRICNGDWTRVVTTGAALTLPVRQGKGPVGIFFDPPYGDVGRDSLYGAHEDFTVAAKVREWCLKHGPDKRYRIVYAGYDEEGADLVAAGWREVEWFRAGFLKGGMGNVAKRDEDDEPTHQQHRERLWCSPHCLAPSEERMLF
jgi:hypothetical protein